MDTNMIRICHGSENIIEKPEFGKGKTQMIMAGDFIVRKA